MHIKSYHKCMVFYEELMKMMVVLVVVMIDCDDGDEILYRYRSK